MPHSCPGDRGARDVRGREGSRWRIRFLPPVARQRGRLGSVHCHEPACGPRRPGNLRFRGRAGGLVHSLFGSRTSISPSSVPRTTSLRCAPAPSPRSTRPRTRISRRSSSKGGKLILWHGFDDPGPSPLATIEYYQKVQKATGAAEANSDLRFYLLPGVYHCRGGPGADQFDSLAAMDAWVDQGKAPETLLATRDGPEAVPAAVPLSGCAALQGGRRPGSAESFECRGPGQGG